MRLCISFKSNLKSNFLLFRIRKIENLDCLVSLKKLYLGKNKIEKIEGLENLSCLDTLSLQNNRIIKIEGLSTLCNLSELYLSYNLIPEICGLDLLHSLTILDLGNNRIHQLENLFHLSNLEDLWLNNNQISSWHFIKELERCKQLNCIYLEHNPICQDPMYRRKLKLAIISLNQIDATHC